jgi:hypothetical protein
VAAAAIARRLESGELPRADEFFDQDRNDRAAAEELLEGVLQAAADAYEERKVPFLGTLYAAIAFDESIGRAYANLLIRSARRLSFRQLVVLAVLWEGDAAEMAAAAAREEPPRSLVTSDELAPEIDELERLGLLGRGSPGGSSKRGGMTFVDASSVPLADLSLSRHGKQLYELMGLDDIPASDRKLLLDEIWRVGLAD